MKATNSINKTGITHDVAANFGGQADTNTLQAPQVEIGAAGPETGKGRPESELRAAARRHGPTVKELASLMGVNYGYLCSVANGRRPWSPMLRERVAAVLGEVPGQGIVYRRGGLVQGESTCIRERARELGLAQKDLAQLVGVSTGYMSDVSRGRRNMSPAVQARVESVLGGPVEIAPAECARRQESLVKGGSTYIREQARALGMSVKELARRVGVSFGYMSDVARGRRNMSPAVQARVEAALHGPVKVDAAQPPTVDPRALWDRMEAHGYSQNETARLAGISSAHLSQIVNGHRTPSGDVLRRLHEVLFQPTKEELVVPAEVKVMAWKKGGRKGVVVRGAGGPGSGRNPGGGTVRIGGRVPWGAEVEFAYTTGYDSRGRVSVNHIVDERGCSVMLRERESVGNDLQAA